MEALSSAQGPLFSLVLQKCDTNAPPESGQYLKKPPCSPPRGKKPAQDEPFYPSPSKSRVSSNKENSFSLNLVANNKEIKIVKVPPENPAQARSSSTMSKKKTKIQSKNLTNCSFTHTSPSGNLIKNMNLNIMLSPVKIQCLTTDSRISKLFTPILSEKKKTKTPEAQEFCKEISLFSNSLNKKLVLADTCSTFKDTSIRNEESTTLEEITPIKEEDFLKECNDFTFNSPEPTIRFHSPPEEILTPGCSYGKTALKAHENLAPRKMNVDILTPESNVFVLSSSSELVSEISISEEVCSFGEDQKSKYGRCDKEMQTDFKLEKVLELLGNEDVIDGLKILGKFKEIVRLINYK